ncbi:MAG TPA: UvrD-helicase domain-containing protein, partial [Geothrix sp.]|nr:UvrD-helicase domain-containing protein [Geothrix sp.]
MNGPLLIPRPAVLDRIPHPFAVLEASAGTGKTFTIEHLVADRVLAGVPLDRILVVTFTDKAALELRTRVRGLLERLLAHPGPEAPEGAPCWILDETARGRLKQARASMERATLATIHSFCQHVLQESALERRSLFDQAQGDARQLFDRAWRELLRGDLAGAPALRGLLREALEAGWTVEKLGDQLWDVHRERAVCVPDVAAAEAHRQRFPPGIDPQEVVAGWAAAKVNAATLRAAQARLGPFLALQERSAFGFASGLEDLGFDSLRKASSKEGLAGAAAAFADWCLAFEPASPEAVLVQAFLGPVQARLEALKAAEGLFDFDDMILRVRDALAGPDGEALAGRLRERFEVALIDECQDTDAAQWEIFRTLFHREGHELVLVGDPKQAIYGFRGGDLPTYLAARD